MPKHLLGTALLTLGLAASSSLTASRIPSPALAQTAAPASGTVLTSDDYSNPAAALFPLASSLPTKWTLGYASGEYQIAGIDASEDAILPLAITQTTTDAMVAVDARVDGDTKDTNLGIMCRWSVGSAPTGYELSIYPAEAAITLLKLTDSGPVKLLSQNRFSGIMLGNKTNHLELTCAGSTITARVNGTTLGSVQDSTYSQGAPGIFVGRALGPGTASARFSSFVVTQP
jgi:hypothetical protein